MSHVKLTIIIVLSLTTNILFSQSPGDLDPDFGTNGLVTSNYSTFGAETFNGVLVQTNGKIVNVGGTGLGAGEPLINRLNQDGSLDTSFGDNGSLILTETGINSFFFVSDAVLQNDNKILFTGRGNRALYVIRLTADGVLDSSFGTNGVLFLNFDEGFAQGENLLIQDDGKILVAGTYALDSDLAYLIVRFLPDGSIDPSFADEGIMIYNPDGWDQLFHDVALQADGKIVCAGSSDPIGRSILMRFLSNGILDTSFGEEGIIDENSLSIGGDEFLNLEIYPDGRILAAGDIVSSSSFTDFLMIRYLPDGSRDSSFGDNGVVKTAVGSTSGGLRGLEILADEKILAAGFGRNTNTGRDFGLVRYLSDGTRDSSFNQDGIVETDVFGEHDFCFDMTTQPDGKILLVGRAHFGASNSDVVTARYIGTDIPDLYLDTNIDFDSLCATSSNIEIDVILASIAGFSEEVTLNLEGLPMEAQVSFSPSNIVDPTSFVTLTLNFEGVATGIYPLILTATTDSVNKLQPITIDIIGGLPEPLNLTVPLDAAIFEEEEIVLHWDPMNDVYSYTLEVATNPSFGISRVINEKVNQDSFAVVETLAAGFYYWRVKSVNRCGESEYSTVWAFQVKSIDCPIYLNEEVDLPIPDSALDTMVSVITLSALEDILDFNIHLDINHFWMGDLTAILISPQGESLVLFDRPGFPETTFGCSPGGPLSLTFDDEAIISGEVLDIDCDTIPGDQPLIGAYQPLGGTLSELIAQGVEGPWTLKIVDSAEDLVGDLTSWSIEVCTMPEPIVPIIMEQNIPINLSNGGIVPLSNTEILATCEISTSQELFYILRVAPANGVLLINSIPVNLGDQFTQKQINENELSYMHNGSQFLVDSFKFDVINQEATWLPNQYYSFTINSAPLTAGVVIENELKCFGEIDGEITITANGGTPPYEYSLNNGSFQGEDSFIGLSAGIYEATIRDNNLELFTADPITISAPEQLMSNVSVAENTVTVVVTGGTMPYSYSIDGQIFQMESVFDDLENGAYTLNIQDVNECMTIDSFEIMTVSTGQLIDNKDLVISPNPTAQFINVTWDAVFRGPFDIQLFNSIGQTVYKMKYNKISKLFDAQIDLTNLSNGVYFVQLNQVGSSITQRIILFKD